MAKHSLNSLILLLGFFFGASYSYAAPLENGDFASGLGGWQASFSDISLIGNIVDPVSSEFTDNFSTSSNGATLTALLEEENNIFTIALYQGFDLPTISTGQSLILSYDLNINLSSTVPSDMNGAGFSFAELVNAGENIDLIGLSKIDITALAGQSVALTFGISDYNQLADQLFVSNITVTAVAAVPVPASVWLFGSALLGLIAQTRRQG